MLPLKDLASWANASGAFPAFSAAAETDSKQIKAKELAGNNFCLSRIFHSDWFLFYGSGFLLSGSDKIASPNIHNPAGFRTVLRPLFSATNFGKVTLIRHVHEERLAYKRKALGDMQKNIAMSGQSSCSARI
jgi:hypothetical protein